MSASLALPKIPDKIVLEPLLSNEEFEQLCAMNSDLRLERTSEGVILVGQLASIAASAANVEITFQLRDWWKTHRRGRTYGSSVGVFLPDGSALGPDAAYATEEQIRKMHIKDLDHFLSFAPAFVIELLSKSDSPKEADRKMWQWIENGVQVGWLVDPYARQVTVYEMGGGIRVETGNRVIGTDPVDGFVLELDDVWLSYSLST
jgi:Uma2 family endonuclease